MNTLFGGMYALALTFHVSLLCLFRLWEMLVHILGSDEWPGAVVAMMDGC